MARAVGEKVEGLPPAGDPPPVAEVAPRVVRGPVSEVLAPETSAKASAPKEVGSGPVS